MSFPPQTSPARRSRCGLVQANLAEVLARNCVVVLVCLAGLAATVDATAKPAGTMGEELSGEALKDWQAALELYRARDFDNARVQFRRAFEVSKNPRTLFNVGVCWKDLTHYAQAIRVWEEELSYRDKLSAEDISKLESVIEALRPFVSTLKVEADEAGAQLSIDGIEIGTTPFLEPVAIDVGKRVVRLTKPGFLPAEREVEVIRGQLARVSFDLQHQNKTGRVAITVIGPTKATLFMDGRELGPAAFTGELPAGIHTFEARAVGYTTTRQTSEVVYGGSVQLTISMAEARNEGKVRVITGFSDSEIRIDGQLRGRGAWEGLLGSGGHQLVVSKSGYDDYEAEIALSANQERTVQVDLSPTRSWVFWTLSLAAVVGGGTVAAVVLSRPSETPAVNGTLDTLTITLP